MSDDEERYWRGVRTFDRWLDWSVLGTFLFIFVVLPLIGIMCR